MGRPAKPWRLADLKALYDPRNVVRNKQNIPPAPAKHRASRMGTP